ncbi:hypothetical protein BGM26_07500 [Bacillus sp. FJAT-29790]|uniref:hypothetical protein n=1 Tax=Bacillus sp. FJAT-29790 TaxID=1895002 RepID=UPI001C23B274|nr:hypothetical protein [Bacillus sp. FJAT-29790]MBU8878830.1 hypothetical protein [Bacillus sp. FJAT-29790]
MKIYLLERLKQVLLRILWLTGSSVLAILIGSSRSGELTVNPHGFFFLKIIVITILIVEVINSSTWLIMRIKNNIQG